MPTASDDNIVICGGRPLRQMLKSPEIPVKSMTYGFGVLSFSPMHFPHAAEFLGLRLCDHHNAKDLLR